MPFDKRFIAIGRLAGAYFVHSEIEGNINERKLIDCARVANLSSNPGYRDYYGIFTREELQQFDLDLGGSTLMWVSTLPREIKFIIVVLNEWESGM